MTDKKTISVRQIPTDLWRLVKIEAMGRGISVTDFLVYALRRALKEKP